MSQGYVVHYHTELTVHFIAFAQIRLYPVPRFLGSGLGRRYAAISAADSTTVPIVGGSKSISSTFVGVVVIASVIIVHATLCRSSSSDLAKAVSIMFTMRQLNTLSYGLSHVYRATVSVSSWANVPWALPINAFHDDRGLSPFFTCASHVLLMF